MNSNPLVSVIMNCYNSDEFLQEAIESVIEQTYQDWEIIFWDNQSTDNSAKIINSYDDKRIKYFYAPKFTPLGEARNLAIEKTTGEWIAFLDCDDLWDKDKLKFSFLELENRQNISLIYSKSISIDKNNIEIEKYTKSPSGNIHNKLLTEGNFIVFSSIIVRKDILNQRGNIDENLNYCEDYDLLLKVTKSYEAIGVDRYLTSYRIHNNNITSTKIYNNNIEVIDLLKSYQKDNNIDFSLKLNIFFNNAYRIGSMSIKLLLKKEFKNIFKLLLDYPLYFLISPLAFIIEKVGRYKS